MDVPESFDSIAAELLASMQVRDMSPLEQFLTDNVKSMNDGFGYDAMCREAYGVFSPTNNSEGITDLTKNPLKDNPIEAPDFLAKAIVLMQERGKEYDKPDGERSMSNTVLAFNAITGHFLKESEGWLLLQLLSDSRQWQSGSFHQDSAEGCVAYAVLKAEALAKGL